MSLLMKREKASYPLNDEMVSFNEEYKDFLDKSKTERESVEYLRKLSLQYGFKEYVRGLSLKPGDKVYAINENKAITFAIIGRTSLNEGANITAAHIDTPAIHVRTVPLYEECGLAYFKTHYYGGIKKYQWLSLPLELRGVVYKKDGTMCEVSIGNEATDPVLVITDLLPHLGKDQMAKKATDIVSGEGLNVLIASTESKNTDKDPVKYYVLELLNEIYGMTESDFMSADLTLVPAHNARDVGLDRSMIGAYGHDDRVCSFTTARALFDITYTPDKTCVCVLVDKEEVGSEGLTGMKSQHFDTFMEDICADTDATLRVCFENSHAISADVSNAYDPNFPEVSEKNNDAKLSYGMSVVKYTGSRGKSGASEASAEMMFKIRDLLDKEGIVWQTGQLGKVDQGGGGTVAGMIAQRNIKTVDAGVPLFSMHAPFEIVAKADVYMAYKGYKAFFENM